MTVSNIFLTKKLKCLSFFLRSFIHSFLPSFVRSFVRFGLGGPQTPRRGHYGGGRGFDRARRHLAGSSGQVSVSATASSPATRRATSELKSWECVGAQLSELPQLWRRAATSRTCLSISVWRAPIGGCGSRTLRQRFDLPVEERRCQLVMRLRPKFEGLGESGRAATVGCRAAVARAPLDTRILVCHVARC